MLEINISGKKLIKIEDDIHQVLAQESGEFAGKQVYGSSHLKLIDTFYRALQGENVQYIHPDAGLPALYIIDALYKSSKTGKTVYF